MESWKRNAIKNARNSGKAYTNWKGNPQLAKKMKRSCENCRSKCAEKISEAQKALIFQKYWDLGDVNRQRDFIAKNVQCNRKERLRKRPKNRIDQDYEEDAVNDSSRRSFTYVYFLPVEGKKIKFAKHSSLIH